MIHDPTPLNFLRITSNMLCIVASMPRGIWTCFRWGNSWSPGASLPRPGSGNQLSSPPVHSASGVVCRRWMQGYTMSQKCSIGFRIALMPSSSRSLWHTPATGELQAGRPSGPLNRSLVGLLPAKPLWAADAASSCHKSRKRNASQEGLKPLFSRGCLSSPPVDRLTWTYTDMTLCSLYFFVQQQRLQTRWTFSPWSCCWCSFVLALTALLLRNRNYSGLLWSYKQWSICPPLPLPVFCPGASSEPCPERWTRLTASSVAGRACGEFMSFKLEVPACVTAQTESADCQ